MPSPIFKCRSDETRYYRCLIGHSKMTKKYIYDREAAPICECGSLLTIKHIFTECPQYQQQRQLHLNNKTCLQSIFSTVEPANIIAFLKDSDVYHRI